MKHRFLIYFLSALFFISCEPEIEAFKPDAGEADFSVYVALGNSLTAGYANGELYKSGQMVSYPNIMAKQMIHAGAREFRQPLMKDELGFGNKIILGVDADCLGNDNLTPAPAGGTPDPANFTNIYIQEGPFHNLGVPGAKVSHLLLPGYGLYNQYFGRFASSAATRIIDDALDLDPTFFSLWIGSNDVLEYAISGGENGEITLAEQFKQLYRLILNELTTKTEKGVLANIPDIASIPFFNTIPAHGLLLTRQGQVDSLNLLHAGNPQIAFHLGFNGFVVADSTSEYNGIRQLQEDELVLLSTPQDRIKCEGWGSEFPIPGNFYLSQQQIVEVTTAINAYNFAIKELAEEFNLALVDINSLLKESIAGINYDGLNFTTQYVMGGVFSLDGVHLSPRGNAIVANHFFKAINKKYGSTIPKVSPTQFPGIIFP
jgi:lysophospholipase L1-like esterase